MSEIPDGDSTHKPENLIIRIPELIKDVDYTKVLVCNPNNSVGIKGHLLSSVGAAKLENIRASFFSNEAPEVPLGSIPLKPGMVISVPLSIAAEAYIRRHGGNLCNFRPGYKNLVTENRKGIIISSIGDSVTILLEDWSIAPFIGVGATDHEFRNLDDNSYVLNHNTGRPLVKATSPRGDHITVGLQLKIPTNVLRTGHSQQSFNEWARNFVRHNVTSRLK